MAVIGYDLANETAIKLIVGLKPGGRRDKDGGFHNFLQEASDFLANSGIGELPMRAAVVRSHEIRNDAQHNGRIPSVEEVEDCRRYTRDFLDHLLKLVWQIELQEVSIIDLVQNENCRHFLGSAESALAEGSFAAAIGNAGAGLKVALRQMERKMYPFEYEGGYPAGIIVADAFGIHRPLFELVLDNNARRSIYSSQATWLQFEQMKTAVIFASMNLNFFEYLNFYKLTGEVIFRGREAFEQRNAMDEPTLQDATFAVNYAINTSVHFESAITP